ncbi:helix-turn-helix protein [Fodinibius salinus]|uniref:Helix-turn-helix protein n=1 Tax=Fodinibius salinus TaxID=860790 RepID=A0A5D3YPC0_9BACT|nr:helix-turn-helix transcriptional regulator [Fodinibius salinus]TYP94879.1 helix-turn-helix protein [Fodinibius salinus]
MIKAKEIEKNRVPLELDEFADLLKEEIQDSQYTVSEVFDKVGIPPQYLSRWKKDDVRPPSYIEIAGLSKILEKPVEYLIYGSLDVRHVLLPTVEYRELLARIKNIAEEKLRDLPKYEI